MSRLILKENVNRVIQKAFDDGRISYKDGQYLMDRIAEIPDGLVRCKDCKHSKDGIGGRIKCTYHNWWQEPNFFCADGERRDT